MIAFWKTLGPPGLHPVGPGGVRGSPPAPQTDSRPTTVVPIPQNSEIPPRAGKFIRGIDGSCDHLTGKRLCDQQWICGSQRPPALNSLLAAELQVECKGVFLLGGGRVPTELAAPAFQLQYNRNRAAANSKVSQNGFSPATCLLRCGERACGERVPVV